MSIRRDKHIYQQIIHSKKRGLFYSILLMQNIQSFGNNALIIINKVFRFSNGVAIPVNHVSRFPIQLSALLARINSLIFQYKVKVNVLVFDFAKGKTNAAQALKGLGGVYILHCKTTGLFYLGSAQNFFGPKGRLNDYFMAGRVNQSILGNSTKVSLDLAKHIKEYGITDFNLIAIPIPVIASLAALRQIEQFWMLLLPTLNKSLSATSNNQAPMPEEQRRAMSTVVYIYEIVHGVVTNTIVHGVKELARTGVLAADGITHNISYMTLSGFLFSGLPWKNQFVFSYVELSTNVVMNRLSPSSLPLTMTTGQKTRGVWVYDSETKAFICYEPKVSSCLKRYHISSTYFKYIRRHGKPFNGRLFSNTKLH